jgi:predicted membrane GTPase involved in stress response
MFIVLRENRWTCQEKMKNRIAGPVSQTGATQEEIEAKMNINQKKMEAEIKSGQEEMKAAISSIRAGLEEAMKYRVEDFLVSLDRQTLGLRKELNRRSSKRNRI